MSSVPTSSGGGGLDDPGDVELPHPSKWRTAVFGLLLGLAWWALAWFQRSALERPWNDIVAQGPALAALAFALGGAVTCSSLRACCARGWLSRFAALALAPFAGSLVVATWCVVLVYATGESIEEIRMEPTIAGKLLWTGICTGHLAIRGVLCVLLGGAWSAVLVLASLLVLARAAATPAHACRP